MEIFFNGKSTVSYYHLKLLYCVITPPKRKQYLIDIPGGDGEIDLCDGMFPARYEPRTVTAVFTPSADYGLQAVNKLLNDLEGRNVRIVLPGDSQHYMTGTVHITAYGPGLGARVAEITVTAVCMPWRYATDEVVHQIPASSAEVSYTWRNEGTREAVPTVTVTGETLIVVDASSIALSAGVYQLTTLTIPGNGTITVSISGGPVEVRYREAVL